MQKIVPFLWFNDQAEQAAEFYVAIFKNSKIEDVSRYGEAGPGPDGAAMVVNFQLEGQEFMAINGFQQVTQAQNAGGIALFVSCETQAELDNLWEKLLEDGQTLQCGWLRDKYGFSWNIVPAGLSDVLGGDDPKKAQQAMKAMLQMEKIDIEELRRAYDGAAV